MIYKQKLINIEVMKIISKYKDYYDYLQGIIGVDNKIILDRREGFVLSKRNLIPFEEKTYSIYKFAICDMLYDVVISHGGKIFHGKEILKIAKYQKFTKTYSINSSIGYYASVKIAPVKTDINQLEKCPIVFCYNKEKQHFPMLKNLGFPRILPAKELFISLYTWIEKQSNPIVIDSRTNIEKIESAGFDKVTSFRNIK